MDFLENLNEGLGILLAKIIGGFGLTIVILVYFIIFIVIPGKIEIVLEYLGSPCAGCIGLLIGTILFVLAVKSKIEKDDF